MSAVEVDTNDRILIAGEALDLMNGESISKDRNFEEAILMLNWMKFQLYGKILIIAV
jgi:hypothetical protein